MKKLAVLIVAIYYCVSSFAVTININAEGTGDYPTIQAAIDAAIIRDIIVLSDGTYTGEGNYDIKFYGKSIIVRSANGPEACIVNCQENGRGFLFDDGEARDSVLSGLTIKKALADAGAAIYCIKSSPTITNCILTENIIVAYGTSWGSGAGIYSSKGSPLISNCRIIDNICRQGKLKAAGIYAENGGINIIGCTVSGHRSTGWGRYSTGIGINSSNGILVRDCIITNNVSRSGGGISIGDSIGIIDNCLVAGNVAIYPTSSSAGLGGGISVNSGNITIANCTIVGNVSNLYGAGLYFWYDTVANVYNCIIWDNIALLNGQGDIGGSEYVNISKCNIEHNRFGPANISSNPFFVESGFWESTDYVNEIYQLGDYHLQESSPCIDGGDNSLIDQISTDLDGNPRIFNEIVDIGAYEFFVPRALVGLEIAGPDEIAEDGFGQYTATAVYDDGSEVDVTDLAEWSLSSDEFAAIDPNGLVVCGGVDYAGSFTIYVHYEEDDIVVEAEKLVSYLPVIDSYYVDGVYGSDDNDGLSVDSAFASIQFAVDAAEDGDSVLVLPDVYNENIVFDGKAVTVSGYEGVPVIDGDGYWAVSFFDGEQQDTVLKNIMITNSYMGIFIAGSSPTIQNVNVISNIFGIEAYNEAEPDIVNCILWENSDDDLFGCQGRYSNIQRAEQAEGIGNISEPPLFVNPAEGNYRLLSEYGRYMPDLDLWVCDQVTSPCINAGDPAMNAQDETQPNGGRINIGAYGSTAQASRGPWALEGDINRDGKVDIEDFAIMAANWLSELTWMRQ